MTKNTDPTTFEAPSPLSQTFGFRLTEWAKGYARVEAPISHNMTNRQGLPHGGVYAAILDTAMGYSGCFTGDPKIQQNALTLSMTVNYLARATGAHLICEARVTGGGRSTFFAKGEVRDETGALIAEATGVFKLRSRK